MPVEEILARFLIVIPLGREFTLNGCGCEARYGCVVLWTPYGERKSFFKTQPLNVLRNEQRNR
jgi:hypothetical protein